MIEPTDMTDAELDEHLNAMERYVRDEPCLLCGMPADDKGLLCGPCEEAERQDRGDAELETILDLQRDQT